MRSLDHDDDEDDIDDEDDFMCSEEFGPDAVVELTPEGRLFYEDLLDACSAEAGRRVSGDDIHQINQRVKAELGLKELLYNDPAVMACFLKHLRSLGAQLGDV